MSSVMLGPFERAAMQMFSKKGVSYPDAENYLKRIYERIGENIKDMNHPLLGEGLFAYVAWLKTDRTKVLKLTTDDSDAYAMEAVRRNPSKYIVKVYDVFKVRKNLYGIVSQKLSPLSLTEKRGWEDLFESVDLTPGFHTLDDNIEEIRRELEDIASGDVEDRYISKRMAQELLPYANTLEHFKDALLDRGIRGWVDYHLGNFMSNKRRVVMSDLGRSKPTKMSLPELD